jgi:ABC-type glycerol-3-phosphate transport system substrate-binding protein
MKKVVFAALVALTVGLVACGGGNGSAAPATDSTAVDSTLVDTTAVAVDSAKVEVSVVK